MFEFIGWVFAAFDFVLLIAVSLENQRICALLDEKQELLSAELDAHEETRLAVVALLEERSALLIDDWDADNPETLRDDWGMN